MRARFPSSWYAQPYASSNLLITSFPVHVDGGRFWQSIPTGGTAIQIYDQPSGSVAACKRLRGTHGHVPLGRFEPNYEGFGAAYRSQFHDHGHTVLVFTSFGSQAPTPTQRRLATAILNSVHVEPGACPVKTIIAIGQHARALNHILGRAAIMKDAAIRSPQTRYTPTLSAARGPVGTTVTVTGRIPPTGEGGQVVHLARLVVWWNLDPRYPSPTVPSLAHARPGRLTRLTTIPLSGQSRYRASFAVPEARPGRYPVVILQETKDGSVAQLGSASFTVTATQ